MKNSAKPMILISATVVIGTMVYLFNSNDNDFGKDESRDAVTGLSDANHEKESIPEGLSGKTSPAKQVQEEKPTEDEASVVHQPETPNRSEETTAPNDKPRRSDNSPPIDPIMGEFRGEYRPLPEDRFDRNELIFEERHVWLESEKEPDLKKSPIFNFRYPDTGSGTMITQSYEGQLIFEDKDLETLDIKMSLAFQSGNIDSELSLSDVAIFDSESNRWNRVIQRDHSESKRGKLYGPKRYHHQDDEKQGLLIFIDDKIFPEKHQAKFNQMAKSIPPERLEGAEAKSIETMAIDISYGESSEFMDRKEVAGRFFLGPIYNQNGRRVFPWKSGAAFVLGRASLVKVKQGDASWDRH